MFFAFYHRLFYNISFDVRTAKRPHRKLKVIGSDECGEFTFEFATFEATIFRTRDAQHRQQYWKLNTISSLRESSEDTIKVLSRNNV